MIGISKPSMTKKHYEAIAAIMKEHSLYEENAIENATKELADYFATDNKNFDRTRFLAACGIEQKTYKGAVCDICKGYSTDCNH